MPPPLDEILVRLARRVEAGRAPTRLQNAASVASLLLTTEALFAEKPDKEKGGAAVPDMGDMEM